MKLEKLDKKMRKLFGSKKRKITLRDKSKVSEFYHNLEMYVMGNIIVRLGQLTAPHETMSFTKCLVIQLALDYGYVFDRSVNYNFHRMAVFVHLQEDLEEKLKDFDFHGMIQEHTIKLTDEHNPLVIYTNAHKFGADSLAETMTRFDLVYKETYSEHKARHWAETIKWFIQESIPGCEVIPSHYLGKIHRLTVLA